MSAVFFSQPQERSPCIRMAGCFGEAREYGGLSAVVVRIKHEKAPLGISRQTLFKLIGSAILSISTTTICGAPYLRRK
jgi:hypothetical protein